MGISITGSQVNKGSGLATQVFEMKEDADRGDYMELIREKMAEMQEKIDNGDIQPSFSTGAQSYTIKEWDKLLQQFDASEKKIQKAQREEIEERTGIKQHKPVEKKTSILKTGVLSDDRDTEEII